MKNLFAWTGRFVVGGLAAFGAFAVYAFLTATPDKPDKPDMPSMALSFALNTCASHEEMKNRLQDTHEEETRIIARVLIGRTLANLSIFVNKDTGAYTQVLSNDYGMSCFWIAGQDWTYIDPPPEEKMDHGV
tara:strand:+ start:1564 stop:1959 length:396 start_codon:yes stop_codon:yes gene_type:complete